MVHPSLETTKGHMDVFFCQLPIKCYLPEVESVGDELEMYPWVASRVAYLEMSRADVCCPHVGQVRAPVPMGARLLLDPPLSGRDAFATVLRDVHLFGNII